MFGAMTSLTGGGGFTGGAATSGNGDQRGAAVEFGAFNINAGAGAGGNQTMLLIGGVALAAVVLYALSAKRR